MVLDAEKRNLPTNNALASFLGNERDVLETTLNEHLITLIKSKALPAGATTAPTKNFAGAGDEKSVAINSGDAGPSTQASRWSKLFN